MSEQEHPMRCTDPLYLVTEKELKQIQNDCAYPEKTSCDGCDRFDEEFVCTFSANRFIDEIVSSRGVAQHDAAIYKQAYEQALNDVEQRADEMKKNHRLWDDGQKYAWYHQILQNISSLRGGE